MRKTILIAVVLFVLFSGTVVQAQMKNGPTYDKFRLDIGGWLVTFNTGASLEAIDYGLGDKIDLENDLGLDDSKTVFRLNGYWRFFDNHRLEFGYAQASRSATAIVDKQLDWGDYVLAPGAGAGLETKVRQYRLNYLWSFYHTDNSEAGLLLGLNYMKFSTALSAWGQVYYHGANPRQIGGTVKQTGSLDAPVPVIGFFWEYYFTEKWKLNTRIDGLSMTIGDVKGNVFEGRVTLDYYFTENVGFGVGYDITNIDVREKGSDLRYRVDWNTDGVLAYFSFKF